MTTSGTDLSTEQHWVFRHGGLVVLLVALVIRLAYVVEHHAVLGLDVSHLPQTDNHVFAQWAAGIADGDLLCREQPHAYHLWTKKVAPEGRWLEWYGGETTYHQAPLYAYMVAAVYALTGPEHSHVGYAQALLGALTCWLTFLIGRRAAGPRTGLAAGLLLSFTGAFYFYDVFLLRDGIMAFFVALTTLAIQRAVDLGRARDWLAAGAALGLFTLAKETGPALLVLLLLCVAVHCRRTPRRGLRLAALVLIGWAVVTAPAFARNRIVGAPTFKLSTRGPEVFVAGNALGQEGVGWDPPPDLMRTILLDSNFKLGSTIVHTLATHHADPWGYVELLWGKTRAWFNGHEVPNNVNFYLHKSHLTTLELGFVSLTFLAPAALLGLLLAIPRRRLAVPLLMFGAISASVVALYILARFRLQALPLFALFAGLTVDQAWVTWRAGRTGTLAAWAIPFVLLSVWCWPSEENPYTAANRDAGMMMNLIRAGNYLQAERFHTQLLDYLATSPPKDEIDAELRAWKLSVIDEAFTTIKHTLVLPEGSAVQHMQRGKGFAQLLPVTERAARVEFTELALSAFDAALVADPSIVGAHHGRGTVLGEIGDLAAALGEFKEETQQHPEHGPSWRDAGMIFMGWQAPGEAIWYLREALACGLDEPRVLACAARCLIETLLRDQPPRLVRGQEVFPYDPELGLRFALRALEADPTDPIVREHGAHVLYATAVGRLGRDDAADADLEQLDAQMDRAVQLLHDLAADVPWRAKALLHRAELFRSAYDRRRFPPETDAVTPPDEEPDAAPGDDVDSDGNGETSEDQP